MISKLRAGLRRYAKSLPPIERAEAEQFAEALLESGEAFRKHLLALLRNQKAGPNLRASSCWTLRVLGDRRAIPVLLKIATDRHADRGLRNEALQSLGMLPSKRAVIPLIDVMLSPEEDPWARRLAAQSLGWLDEAEGRDALFRVVKDQTVPPEVRGDAAEALSYFRDTRSVPILLDQLRDPSPDVRFWAVFALGQLAEPDVLPELERIAASDDAVLPQWWSIRKEALDAIRSIKARAEWRDAEE